MINNLIFPVQLNKNEISLQKKWITKKNLLDSIKFYGKCEYAEYLKKFYKTKGVSVPKGFVYNSNNNQALMSKSALQNMLKKFMILQ